MKKEVMEIYGTNVEVYSYTAEEVAEGEILFKGLPENQKPICILKDKEYTGESRKVDSYYGMGNRGEYIISVLAKDLDGKQLSNLFVFLGAKEAYITPVDLNKISAIHLKDEKVSEEKEEKPKTKKKARKKTEK
ncbi:hypothetical protein QO179_24320 [Bacillus stercoris]|nr:hypothetical protein [Bacillus stercoris]